jgi:hypothetical protein
MLVKVPSGTWLPSRVPESPVLISILLLFCAMVESAVSHELDTFPFCFGVLMDCRLMDSMEVC